jgi:hypothetical protein
MSVIKIDTVSKITGEPLKKRGRKSNKEKKLIQDEIDACAAEETKNLFTQDNIVISIDDANTPHYENITTDQEDSNSNNVPNNMEESKSFLISEEQKPIIKKRGRKPKGGKIIQQIVSLNNNKDVKPNVILHLKCSIKDLYNHSSSFSQTASNVPNFVSYNEYAYDTICSLETNVNTHMNNKNNNTHINSANQISEDQYVYDDDCANENEDMCKYSSHDAKETYKKLKILQHNLHTNNINDKKSACFWCTCDFDNPPIYIPKHFIKDTYEVYGCFCSPECATAHLMEENIDSSDKFERYHLINHIYGKIYDYKKNIKPAPNPYYLLDKYYGNLSIQEFRTLLRGERLFLVVEKPLTRILPELHEDNDDFIINNKIIPSNTYQIKKKMQKKQNKTNIVNEQFGVNAG